jgi:uncharacterized membrane protein YkvI
LNGNGGNIIKVACIYTTTIIGAGFASGQEIVQFFSLFREDGFYGIIFAGLLFSAIGYIVLGKVYDGRIRSYEELIFPMLGWFAGWIVEIVVALFMLLLYCVMIAGASNIISDRFGIQFQYAILLMSILCLISILTSIKGIVALSTVVTPLLITGMLAVGFYIIVSKDVSVFNIAVHKEQLTRNWFFSSLIYVSYNSLLSVVVMCSLLPYLKSRKVGTAGGILGGTVLCIIALVLNYAIFLFYPASISGELPILGIVKRYSLFLSGLYSIILFLAMFTSAITAGYCLVDRVSSKISCHMRLTAIFVCALAIPLSGVGFSRLISTVYPVFGYVGLFLVFAILLQGIKPVVQRLFKQKQN